MKAKIISFVDTPQLQFALSGATAEDDLKFLDGACPRGSFSTLPALSPCNGCPLFEVCSDECGMNETNGYRQTSEEVESDYKGLFFNS